MKGPGRGAGWKREGMALGKEGSAGGVRGVQSSGVTGS